MITVYGYDKDNDIYDNLAEIHEEDAFGANENDVLYGLVWCAKFLIHHARSSSGDEYDWICISKDTRDREEDMIMYLKCGAKHINPVIILEHKDYKEQFKTPENIWNCSFDFIGW